MRSVLALILGLVTLVMTAVAVPAAWTSQNLTNQQGFVELAAPMGQDAQFRSALAEAIAEEVRNQSQLPPGLQELVDPIIARAAGAVTGLEEFPQAWNEALAKSHTLTLEAEGPDEGALRLDIAPIVALAIQRVADTLGTEIPVQEELIVDIGQADQLQSVDLVQRVANEWRWISAGALAGLLLTLLVARRASTALAWLGVGAVILGVGFWLAAEAAPDVAAQHDAAGPVADAFTARFVELAATSFQPWAVVLAGAGLAAAVIGVTARQLSGRRA
ncbi:hypothetical protein [Crystallibacter degradans]|uniref:hypothetical protein n=1 Tax=Crystallibacter degradans TaxID=2726743 RepID=UPI001474CAC4|nr:hypothetical protein [Arthrobacter sp. SF27]NMR29795.1 hypothetical protein [Arthrobacter sp. SF27]